MLPHCWTDSCNASRYRKKKRRQTNEQTHAGEGSKHADYTGNTKPSRSAIGLCWTVTPTVFGIALIEDMRPNLSVLERASTNCSSCMRNLSLVAPQLILAWPGSSCASPTDASRKRGPADKPGAQAEAKSFQQSLASKTCPLIFKTFESHPV